MNTQKSSKQRVKNDTVGAEGLRYLFSHYPRQSLEDFRNTCVSMIVNSSGKPETKRKFVDEIDAASDKETMLKKVTNYIMAGQGYGV